MAKKNGTVFSNLNNILFGETIPKEFKRTTTYNITSQDPVLFSTDNKEEYDRKMAQLRQQKLLSYQWIKAGADNAQDALAGLTNIKMMYRDADLMCSDTFISSALEIVSDEACCINSRGKMLNIYSRSERIKAILEDLFVNRLSINIWLPSICYNMLKYGNTYMLFNVTFDEGIRGWREMHPYDIERFENGAENPYAANMSVQQMNTFKSDDVSFVRVGKNDAQPFKSWQLAHFRYLTDTFFLPYGCIVGDSRIETEDGYKTIDNIEIGDKVWTFNVDEQKREIATVSMMMYKGVKPVYSLKTRHNYIEGTADHRFLCYENKQLHYKELQDIKVGDLIVIDNSIEKQNSLISIDKSPLKENEANLKKSTQWWDENLHLIPDFVDEKFAEFFGFMIGDGWITDNKYVYFAAGEYDVFNKKYIDYLSSLTNNKIRLVKAKHNTKLDYLQVMVSSKCLATILRRMGFVDGFDKKRIPSWVFKSNDAIKRSFLQGLMTADGSYFIDKFNVLRCSIEMSNEQLIKDIKILVQSLGYKSGQISSRVRKSKTLNKIGNRKILSTHTSYYFYFFESFNKQEKKYDIEKRKNDGFKTEKVLSIEYVGEKGTYDITVNNNNSNFFANGIITHNCSYLHKARRAWRMLSMMEDAMLIYRLDKSIERRVFKIYVGAIDDADVPAYVQQVANNFKRTPVVDPLTGQVDLRKNFMDVSTDYFIPVRSESAPTPIETLSGAQTSTSMDDIEYMRNKIFAALRIPKSFLNFQDAQGKGQNLSIMDIRFTRMVNRVQQFLLMELNKVAIIHLYLMGFTDDLNNFTLTMNNPSPQIEAQELEDISKRVQTAQSVLADPGIGIPMWSLHRTLKEIMKMTDKEIADNLNEIRLEKALAAELTKTEQIIKRTGLFDPIDNIYGEMGAEYQEGASGAGEEGGMGGLGGGGGFGGGNFGDGLGGGLDDMGGGLDDLGGPADNGMGDIGGAEGMTDMGGAPAADAGTPPPMESRRNNKPLLVESVKKKAAKGIIDQYLTMLETSDNEEREKKMMSVDISDKSLLINESIQSLLDELQNKLNEEN